MKVLEFLKHNLFTFVSWFVTFLIVGGIVVGGLWYKDNRFEEPALVPEPTACNRELRASSVEISQRGSSGYMRHHPRHHRAQRTRERAAPQT